MLRTYSRFFRDTALGSIIPAKDPVSVFVVAESHGFPEADGAVPDPIGNKDIKMVLAIVHELSSVAMPRRFGVDVDRVDSEDRLSFRIRGVTLATGFTNAVFSA